MTSVMNKRTTKNAIVKWRVYSSLAVFLLVSVAIVSQLYRIQIVQGESYSIRAENQHIRPNTNVFDRGSIFFTNKNGDKINAATLKTGYTIAINPSSLRNPEDVFNNLNFYLDLDIESYLDMAGKVDDPYEEIATKVPYDVGQEIRKLEMRGVLPLRENWRFYPGGDLASHVVGFMSYMDNELSGRYGLEKQYNQILSKDNNNMFSNFFVEIFSSAKNVVERENDKSGSLITTINPEVQSFVQKEMIELNEKWDSKKTGAIVMNPQNGEIYSMALYPTFDLNSFGEVENASVYRNDLVENVYEMGSIVKPLTVAIGLDTKSITAQTTYNDKGSETMDGYTFYNYDKKARGVVDMQQVLNKSLNTGVSFIVQQVGNEKFGDYMKKLFKNKTEIDLPNESSSLIANLNSNRDIENATASFGQGIAMSPVSITRALASLGNGGKLVHPHLVKKIEYNLGFSKNIQQNDPVQIFEQETSEEITRMLVNVVDEALRGGEVALNNYSIAAKTGTAQIPSPDGGYYDDKFLHSFFGYFPAYDPQFIVFLYHIEPQGAEYASETLTEPFMDITKFLINHYDVEPDRDLTQIRDEQLE
ncbi:penicillin-binding protein 2 [Candidatus Parcubacteria bacterium]|nr:penicillin-binding protein 2 [Candidatus Parcubacteria bacterium]